MDGSKGTRKQALRSVDLDSLIRAYYDGMPDFLSPSQRVSFGTSGHRGSSLKLTFNEAHILAIAQAICDFRKTRSIDGPLFLARDTHALSEPAFKSALEVFAGNGIQVIVQRRPWIAPTPVISHAILRYNRGRIHHLADGVVVTPSHNPPEDGGFKYNPPHGGPAESEVTREIEQRANAILEARGKEVKRLHFPQAIKSPTVVEADLIGPYVMDLGEVVDMEAIKQVGLRIGVDPLGGSTLPVWTKLAEVHGVDLEIVNKEIDPSFSFMPPDNDGRVRMDCSSPKAMAGLLALKERFDIAMANDPDGDRHGIVTPVHGLWNPNKYLSLAAWYLFRSRDGWNRQAALGKTVVTTSMLDKMASSLGRKVAEVGVGFKWFVKGLLLGYYAFGGEESAGASFLRKDGRAWTTDKDGIIMGLLAVEILSREERTLEALYEEMEAKFGQFFYERIDRPISPSEKRALSSLRADMIKTKELAGAEILTVLDKAPADGAEIGGIKVVTPAGWFAARPSGTEDVYKLYAESFLSQEHLERIKVEAQEIIEKALRG